ncbi:uncharacterized protein [Eleutherodactylus coqui]|uniref:uncharacterized protein n=1 Tax=Eleutherodactylus coqui TaxID=57060 RepID=UPI003461D705
MNEGTGEAAPEVKSLTHVQNSGWLKLLLSRIFCICPLKYVLKSLKMLAGLPQEVENMACADQISPRKRRFVSGKKRLGRLARLILFIAPNKMQGALGYRTVEDIGKTSTDDIKKSPLKPCGKGSKRKQDDLDIEEQHSWVTFMTEDLPDEDEDGDATYEPSNSESDSEENKSKNDTESDLEVEERDGIVMLKESVQENRECNEEQPCASEGKAPNPDEELGHLASTATD